MIFILDGIVCVQWASVLQARNHDTYEKQHAQKFLV